MLDKCWRKESIVLMHPHHSLHWQFVLWCGVCYQLFISWKHSTNNHHHYKFRRCNVVSYELYMSGLSVLSLSYYQSLETNSWWAVYAFCWWEASPSMTLWWLGKWLRPPCPLRAFTVSLAFGEPRSGVCLLAGWNLQTCFWFPCAQASCLSGEEWLWPS